MSSNERITWLMQRVQTEDATPDELKEILDLLQQDDTGDVRRWLDAYYATHLLYADPATFNTPYWEDAIVEVLQQDVVKEQQPAMPQSLRGKVVTIHKKWWWAAAAVLLLAATWLHIQTERQKTPQVVTVEPGEQHHDIAPGGNRAMLTLADGSVITLDSMANGLLTKQGDIKVVKVQNGELSYSRESGAGSQPFGSAQGSMQYNTLKTPRGGQYQLTLPDGTKAWLNAASSISYPVVFAQKERKVTVTGEVYFEVAKVSSPKLRGGREGALSFIVDILPSSGGAGGGQVEVLGTHFNINSYANEDAIRTTLLEGRVKVSRLDSGLPTPDFRLLNPGEQAAITTNHKLQTTNKINVEQITAWKNGRFDFNGLTLPAVMRQLERWYDIDVVFAGAIPADTFKGRLTRDLTLVQLLNILTNMEIKYRLEGRRLVIL